MRGSNPTTVSTDTTSNWAKLGSGIWYISESGTVRNQNFQYGLVINVALTVNDVFQIWNTQPYGNVLYRCGNGSGNNGGWYINWTPFSPGTATAAQVLKGYTFSSAAGSNLTGTYDPGDNYNNGYNAGRTQGRNDVTGNPNGYGLYTKSQYDANWSNGYTNGVSAKASKIWTGHVTITSNGSVNVGFEPHIILIKRDGDNFPIGIYCSYGISVNHIEGPSNSHLENIFSTNGNGFSFGNLNSYTNNKYCYCAAVRIV